MLILKNSKQLLENLQSQSSHINSNRMFDFSTLLYSSSMVMRDIGSFHCPEPRFISRGEAEGNKLGRGVMNTACITK